MNQGNQPKVLLSGYLFHLESNLGGLQCKARVNKWGVCVCVFIKMPVISKPKEESLSLSIEKFILKRWTFEPISSIKMFCHEGGFKDTRTPRTES